MKVEKIILTELFPHKQDAFAIVIDDVFTKEECQEMIDMTEKIGYTEALVGYDQVRVVESRNNWRCMVDDPKLADVIFQRIKSFLPKTWLSNTLDSLNERLRFLKYNPGEYFKPHNDGNYVNYSKTKISYITIHLYLNDVEEGGETTFTTEKPDYNHNYYKNKNLVKPIKTLSVKPKIGRILIFEQHLLHEGSELKKGLKYTMRTDVMYKVDVTKGNVSRLPRWQNSHPHPQYKF